VTHAFAADLAGFPQALDALRRVGGVLLPDDAAHALAAALVAVVTPLIKAETLADIADDLADMAHHFGEHEPTGLALNHVARSLDSASAQIREGTR
jgi:hypothetical protein